MRTRTTIRAGVLVLTLAATSAAVGVTISAAGADPVSAPWQNAAPDPDRAGSLSFYDGSGKQVYSGDIDEPFGYVVGSSGTPSGDTKATLYAYRPTSGTPVGAWSGSQLTAAADFPTVPTGIPAGPALKGTSADQSIAAFTVAYPSQDTTSGYTGVYELRLRTTKAGSPAQSPYDVADIQVTGSRWTLVYPKVTVATTTSVAVSPTSAPAGTAVTLTATVSSASGSPSGTVQFYDGAETLGDPVAVSNGTATASRVLPHAGNRSITGTFTSSNGEPYGTSTGAAPATAARASSTVTGTVSTTRPVYGRSFSVRAVATAAGLTPTGAVQVTSGSAVLATGSLAAGAVTIPVSGTKLAPGAHPLTVTYLGSNDIVGSSVAVQSVTVAKASSRSVNTLKPTKIKKSKRAKLTARVSVTGVVPTGRITVYDGKKRIKTATLVASRRGILTLTLPKLKAGKHSLHVVYGGSNTVSESTARAVRLTVKK